jgi:hypothetical protein
MKAMWILLIIWIGIMVTLTWSGLSHAHGIHLADLKGQIVLGSMYAGNKFKTTDGKCWELLKKAEPDTLVQIKLHAEETTCEHRINEVAQADEEIGEAVR